MTKTPMKTSHRKARKTLRGDPMQTTTMEVPSRILTTNRPDPTDLLFEYSVGGRFSLEREKLLDFDTWDQSH